MTEHDNGAHILSMEPAGPDRPRRGLWIAGAAILAAVLVGVGILIGRGGGDESAEAPIAGEATTTERPSTASTPATTMTTITTTITTTTTTTSTPPSVTMPSGTPVFAGYPKLVNMSDIDSRVASWLSRGGSTQAVALAPGVYAAYNPNVPDLNSYLDGPSSGDCAMRREHFPGTGGACWSGVN